MHVLAALLYLKCYFGMDVLWWQQWEASVALACESPSLMCLSLFPFPILVSLMLPILSTQLIRGLWLWVHKLLAHSQDRFCFSETLIRILCLFFRALRAWHAISSNLSSHYDLMIFEHIISSCKAGHRVMKYDCTWKWRVLFTMSHFCGLNNMHNHRSELYNHMQNRQWHLKWRLFLLLR